MPGEFAAVRCLACNFCYTNPRPFGEKLGFYYPDSAGYYGQEEHQDPQALINELTSKRRRQRLRRLGYEGGTPPTTTVGIPLRALQDGIPPARPGGTLLEVGCSTGAFLYQLQHLGWTCHGIELNQAAAAHARERLGLNVSVSTLEDADLPANGFDAIVMRMVLEHLPAPVDALNQLHQALRPGGWLVFSVPNFGSPERRLFNRHTYNLHIPQHLSHFTPQSVRAALEKTGFTLDRICQTTSHRDFWSSVENRKFDYGEHDWLVRTGRIKLVRRLIQPMWNLYSLLTCEGSRMMVYARKPGGEAEMKSNTNSRN